MSRYTIIVADNFHYQDESESYTSGTFDSYEDAVQACRGIVDHCLADHYTLGMTDEQLYRQYTMFGEDPFILPAGPGPRFSAWDYAKGRAVQICRTDAGLRPQTGE